MGQWEEVEGGVVGGGEGWDSGRRWRVGQWEEVEGGATVRDWWCTTNCHTILRHLVYYPSFHFRLLDLNL